MGTPMIATLLSRLLSALRWLVAASVLLVMLSSCQFRTARFYPDGSGMHESVNRWAGWTFLLGLLAVGLLALWLWTFRAWPLFGGGVVVALGVAAISAGDHWRALLAERALDRDDELVIAAGLPVVTVARATGAGLALLSLGVWLFVRDRGPRPHLARQPREDGIDGPVLSPTK